ncbi:MAG: DNA alkylation repair protein [Flavobacteriales bacterium]|nr:DNA alkylation repair protein [Flavobacteriales bacterium]MBK9194547.1 DNA alkylation repair protein [Flavobacteriales bacterium]
MAEPLKEMFNRAYFERLAKEVEGAAPRIQRAALIKDLLHGNEARELNARMRHASTILRKHLPTDFRKAVNVLKDVAPRMSNGYTALLYPDFVGLHGLDDPIFSLDALKHFTGFGSSEFAVREFFRRDVKGTLNVMREWAEDDSEHVRRLASEGSRPRLPWSFRLDAVLKDPTLTTPILERLRADDSLYVRKSVANHLNDFSKDHPAYMIDVLRSWDGKHPHTAWIAKHASRTLIKAGNPDALALFAFDSKVKVRVDDLVVSPKRLKLGDTMTFSFTVTSEAARSKQLVIDYALHYRKANGGISRKVFKLKEVEIAGRGSLKISKRQRIVDFSTRKHCRGEHIVEVLVNGKERAKATFDLKA